MGRLSIAALIALGALLFGASSPAWSQTYYLSSDLGVQGPLHLCRYSDGRVYSFKAMQLCPLQVQNDEPPPYSSPPSTTGFKAGEYRDGMTKICVYNVMGKTQAIRISAVDLCPLSYNF